MFLDLLHLLLVQSCGSESDAYITLLQPWNTALVSFLFYIYIYIYLYILYTLTL